MTFVSIACNGIMVTEPVQDTSDPTVRQKVNEILTSNLWMQNPVTVVGLVDTKAERIVFNERLQKYLSGATALSQQTA